MKKIKTSIIAASLAFAPCAYAQDVITIPNLDMDEDTTEVTTVSDIVKMQQKVITNNNTEKHYLDMWKRRTYLNIAQTPQVSSRTTTSTTSQATGACLCSSAITTV